MKNLDWLKVGVISISVIIAGFFIGNMHKIGKKYDHYVEVKGLSEREVNADLAVWPLNISVSANDLGQLKREIESQNKQVYNFFINQGFSKEELTVGSTNINDVYADMYNQNSRNSEFRYLAKSDFTIRTNNIERLREEYFHTLKLTRHPSRPELWDGRTAERIVGKLVEVNGSKSN